MMDICSIRQIGHMMCAWSEPFMCEDDHQFYQKRHCYGCNKFEYRRVEVVQ